MLAARHFQGLTPIPMLQAMPTTCRFTSHLIAPCPPSLLSVCKTRSVCKQDRARIAQRHKPVLHNSFSLASHAAPCQAVQRHSAAVWLPRRPCCTSNTLPCTHQTLHPSAQPCPTHQPTPGQLTALGYIPGCLPGSSCALACSSANQKVSTEGPSGQ